MREYRRLVRDILDHGEEYPSRSSNPDGGGSFSCKSITNASFEWDLDRRGFPLVTAKETNWRSAFVETWWMMNGFENTRYLRERGVRIWDEWADDRGDLGPVYGWQWRSQKYGDQLRRVVQGICDVRFDPKSEDRRRLIVDSWNPAEIDDMALQPCH